MRYFTFLLLFATSVCFSQSQGDTKIIVTATDTINLLTRAAASLTKNGFTIDAINEGSRTIETGEKKLKRLNASMKLKITIKDSTCIISAEYALDFHFKIGSDKDDRIFNPVENRGIQGNIHRECWEEMETIAKSIGTQS